MRSLNWAGTTVAIIVMSSAAAGQKQSHSAVADRLLSFDANGDGRIMRDELPERMEGKVYLGDKNQDGFLTPEEIIALVATQSPVRRVQRFSARSATSLAEIIADQKLPRVTHDRAMEIVKEHTFSGTIDDSVRDKLYAAMREVLGDEDYENFVAAVTRLRNTSRVVFGGIVGGVVNTPASRPR